MIRYRENDFLPTPDQYRAWLRRRLMVLDYRIAARKAWGPVMTAMNEERKGIRAILDGERKP